jgi:hypothetical protein
VPVTPYSWVNKSRTIAFTPSPIYRNTDGKDDDPKIVIPTSTKKKANDGAKKKKARKDIAANADADADQNFQQYITSGPSSSHRVYNPDLPNPYFTCGDYRNTLLPMINVVRNTTTRSAKDPATATSQVDEIPYTLPFFY